MKFQFLPATHTQPLTCTMCQPQWLTHLQPHCTLQLCAKIKSSFIVLFTYIHGSYCLWKGSIMNPETRVTENKVEILVYYGPNACVSLSPPPSKITCWILIFSLILVGDGTIRMCKGVGLKNEISAFIKGRLFLFLFWQVRIQWEGSSLQPGTKPSSESNHAGILILTVRTVFQLWAIQPMILYHSSLN
jgi:hypothetical protein